MAMGPTQPPLLVLLLLLATLVLEGLSFAPCRQSAVSTRQVSSTRLLESGSVDDEDDDISLGAFQERKRQQQEAQQQEQDSDEFDGYALRDIIVEKWGKCYDLEFNLVDSFGFRQLYLNVLPFHLGGRRFRHETELDYLCHLQAVAEILLKYNQIGYVLVQIDETNKKPRAGTSPLVAVPLRLDLTKEQVEAIIGY